MTLTDMWTSSQEQLADKKIDQVIKFAGEGRLNDGNDTSHEFRDFLSHVPSTFLRRYAAECLAEKFDDGGRALQDILNEVGRRLGFEVTNGRYRGVTNAIGHDGLWRSSDGHAIVAESKTTAAYQIHLDTLGGYRKSLVEQGEIVEDQSSILIIVGRENTSDLEAQVRGSRFAWDIRLVSVESLLRLMEVKEDFDDPKMVDKIRQVLAPREYTKVDGIIDLVFETAADLKSESEALNLDEDTGQQSKPIPVSFNEACVARIEKAINHQLLRRSRAMFATADDKIAVVCAVSREYGTQGHGRYWFAFHPHHKEALEEAAQGYVAFGCGSEASTLMIPAGEFFPLLEGMNITQLPDRMYWHIRVSNEGEKFFLRRKGGAEPVEVTKYLI